MHDYAPQIKALLLASPAFKVKLYIPFALGGISLWQKIAGQFYVKSYVKGKHLSHDPNRIQSYHTDPLVALPIASNILLELDEVSKRVVADSGAIHTPTLLLMSGADFVVKHSPQHAFFDGLSSLIKEKHILPGFYHDTLGELEREKAFIAIRSFIEKIEKNTSKPSLFDADKKGYTFDEYQTLLKPLPLWHPKRWYYGTTQVLINILGQYSAKGIKVGVETGFDSGS